MAFYFVSTFAIAQTPTKQPALRLSRTKNLHFAKAPFPGFSAKAFRHAVQSFEGVLRSQHRVYDGRGEVARTQDDWGAEGISGRVKFLLLAWAGMPKTSFRKNSDSPLAHEILESLLPIGE
jgi:hypothetical protein